MALVLLAAMFGLDLPMPGALLAPPVILLICFSAYCWGLFIGALVALAPSLRNVIGRTASVLLMAFCGVSVPVAFWPEWIQLTVQFLPLTHGLESVRLLLDDGSGVEIVRCVVFELTVGLGWLGATAATMDRLANRGRANGSIEFVR